MLLAACSGTQEPAPIPSAGSHAWNLVLEPRNTDGTALHEKASPKRAAFAVVTVDGVAVNQKNFKRFTGSKPPKGSEFKDGKMYVPLPFRMSIPVGKDGPHAVIVRGTLDPYKAGAPALGCSLLVDTSPIVNDTQPAGTTVDCGAAWTEGTKPTKTT